MGNTTYVSQTPQLVGADYTIYESGSTFYAVPSASASAAGAQPYSNTDPFAVMQSVLDDISSPCHILLTWNDGVQNGNSSLVIPSGRQIWIEGVACPINAGTTPTSGTVLGTNGYQISDGGSNSIYLKLTNLGIVATGSYSSGTSPFSFPHNGDSFNCEDCVFATSASTNDNSTWHFVFGGSGSSGTISQFRHALFSDCRTGSSGTTCGAGPFNIAGENPVFENCTGLVYAATGTLNGFFNFGNANGRVTFRNWNWFLTSNVTATYNILFSEGPNYAFQSAEILYTRSNGSGTLTITNTFYGGTTYIEFSGYLQEDTGGTLPLGPNRLTFSSGPFYVTWADPFLDNRKGLTSADGSAKTLITTSSSSASNYFPQYLVFAKINATAYTSGTPTYTLKWTENSTSQQIQVTASAANTEDYAYGIANPDPGTTITTQLTGTFSATVNVSGLVRGMC